MIGSLLHTLKQQTATTSRKDLLTWGAVGLLVAALLVVSVAELNRLAIILMITVPMLTLVVINVEFGIYCLLGYASVVAFAIRMLPPGNTGPIGIALDVLLLLMALRLAADLFMRRDWKIMMTPLTIPVVVFTVFQCIEVFNPAAPSIMFGLWGMRVTIRILGFFLILYYFRNVFAIKRLVWFWLVLMFGIALYGIFQHHHGLLWQEMAWLLSEGNAKTHILGGYVRVFSTVGDAATFGFLMIMAVLMVLAMALTAKPLTQVLLLASTLPMLYGMTLSYSRGPVVALVAGAAIMIVASRNWKLGMAAVGVGFLGLTLLVASGSTRLVDRLETATNPMEDASFMVRVGYITDYVPEIAKRPFGYGINTSGGSGLAAAGGAQVRNSVVGVPTDNYYFKVALEMGWVGLTIFLWLYFAAMWHAYLIYRRTDEPYLKAIALGLLSVQFSLFAGAFSNDIHAQKPISEFFWIAIGLSMLIGQHQRQLPQGAPVTAPLLPPPRRMIS